MVIVSIILLILRNVSLFRYSGFLKCAWKLEYAILQLPKQQLTHLRCRFTKKQCERVLT